MYVVGVDLGATNLRVAVADANGRSVATYRRGTPRGPDGDAVTDAVLAAVRAACANAGIEPGDVAAAGIASIGPLDRDAGTVRDTPNLPDAVGRIPLVAPLRDLLATDRVVLHNDATAGAVAERFYRTDPPDDLVYLTISSGIGAGVVVDGRVLAGANGNAGEVGHFVVDPDGRTCGCGRDGHWEAYCGGEHVPDYARDLADADTETALPLDDPDLSAADVFARAPDDDFAARVVDRVADWNVVGVTDLVQAYDPALVSVGGAVALENEPLVVDPVRDRLPETSFVDAPRVERTPLGEDVVLEGAVASALTAADTTRE